MTTNEEMSRKSGKKYAASSQKRHTEKRIQHYLTDRFLTHILPINHY